MARWDLCWCSISFRCVRERSDRRKVGGLKGLDRLANCKRESEIGRERGSNDSNTNTNKYDQHSSNNKYIERVDQVIMFDNGSDIDWMHHIANQSKMCINTWWSMPAFGNRFTCFHEAKKTRRYWWLHYMSTSEYFNWLRSHITNANAHIFASNHWYGGSQLPL